MPVSFSATTGKLYDPITVNATSLTASTVYIATVTSSDGTTQRIEFTTNGAGTASFTYVPNIRGVASLTYQTKVVAASGSGSNTFTGV